MPLQATSGAATYDAFGSAAADRVFIESCFSTYLYTGNGSTQTITNGIDLSTKGGLVWIKSRSASGAFTGSNNWCSTAQGVTKFLISDGTQYQQQTDPRTLTAFNSNGFSLGTDAGYGFNANGATQVSWTFRKQAKFFDIQTWTGNGSNRTISHALGVVPGCIIVRRIDDGADWQVYHRSTGNTKYLVLNSTAAEATSSTRWNNTTPTSTVFSIGTEATVNASGGTYVAYLFAHDAGGFGLSGTDNVISCGSTVSTGGTVSVTLGYEPQWLLMKNASNIDSWYMYDTMRGLSQTNDYFLKANTSDAEGNFGTAYVKPTATGFTWDSSAFGASGETYIYIAIRRGPMKTPTSGTSVFSPNIWTGTGSTQQITTGFFPDMFIGINRGAVHAKTYATDILRGLAVSLATNVTDAENSESGNTFNMTGYSNNNGNLNSGFGGGQTYVGHFFRRAPGFFDVVCYTGTSTSTTQTHNLGAAPELMITKCRSTAGNNWSVYSRFTPTTYGYNTLQTDSAGTSGRSYGPGGSPNFEELSAAPTSTVINLASSGESNFSGRTYVAYLFATVAGVSKVGSYTGSGTTKQIDCGFTGGARFVLIKRTDNNGDWYVYDSARGIVSGNDSYLLLNSTAAEVTNTDYVDTYSAGFELSSTAPAGLNANGGTYIFLAIA